jgi:hypothetical protein
MAHYEFRKIDLNNTRPKVEDLRINPSRRGPQGRATSLLLQLSLAAGVGRLRLVNFQVRETALDAPAGC